jgi:hypothetical protein
MLNVKISSWWFLGGPPMFVACQSISLVVIELWAVEAFCFSPVIACLFFLAGVAYVGDASLLSN